MMNAESFCLQYGYHLAPDNHAKAPTIREAALAGDSLRAVLDMHPLQQKEHLQTVQRARVYGVRR